MDKKVLLTGANGFLGKNARTLLKDVGYEVHSVSSREILSIGAIWHKIDLLDSGAVSDFIKNLKPDYLLHLAWDTTPGKYLNNPQNLEWVAATLGLCRKFYENGGKRAVFAGTCFEYNLYDQVLKESSVCIPSSLYGACKHALSEIINKYCTERNLSFAWGRIFYLYGPYENEGRVIPYVINSLLGGKEALCSHAVVRRDYIYVEDVAAALTHLLNIDESGIFNIGSGKAVPLRDILSMTAKLIGRLDLLKLGELLERTEAPIIEADISKLTRTGFSPKYGIKEGLEETIDWWKVRRKS